MLPHKASPSGDSRYSWTVDVAARRAQAREKTGPLIDQAAEIKAKVIDLKDALRRLKRDKAPAKKIEVLEADIRTREKAARDLEAEAAEIDAAVFDLKAVNPNAVTTADARTPEEILVSIQEQGRILADALTRLKALLATAG